MGHGEPGKESGYARFSSRVLVAATTWATACSKTAWLARDTLDAPVATVVFVKRLLGLLKPPKQIPNAFECASWH